MAIRSTSLVVMCWLLGCGGDNPGGPTASGDGDGSGSSGTTMSSGPTSTSNTTSATQSATDDATMTDTPTSASTETASGTVSETTDTPTSTATSDDATGTDATTMTTNVDDSSSSDGGRPAVHELSNSDQTECTQPLWCQFNAQVGVPGGDPIEGQECFVSPVAPPFELIEMHYIVASTHTDLEEFSLRVYERDGGAPTNEITSVLVTSVKAKPIEHYYEFDPPIMIDTQEFCVGFAAEEQGLASAIGMAVDTASSVADVSYVRMEGNGDCDIPDWEDATTHAPPPAGNWCMDATIRELP